MHEMGIAMEIVEIAIASIPAGMQEQRVERINMKIGKLSVVVPESLRFCFEIVAKGTPLCNAELNIEEVPVVVRCRDCNSQETINEPVFACRKCSSGSIEVISGRELDITSIEIADEDEADADKAI